MPLQQKLQTLWKADNLMWAGEKISNYHERILNIPLSLDIYDTLYALMWHDLPLPVGVNREVYHQIQNAQLELVTLLYNNQQVRKLG